MRILVTGGAGYLGSVLIPELLNKSHKVRILDIGYFGFSHLKPFFSQLEIICEDIRKVYKDKQFREDLVNNCDCIIHLAAISNDPSCKLSPKLTEEVNVKATEALAEIAKIKKIKFIFSSSCSVYGRINGIAKEDYPLNPLSIYAESKLKAENILNGLSDGDWRPIILRSATLFGYSYRMRFDLVINIFSLYSTLYNKIRLFNQGKDFRPFIHVKDCARAFVYFLEKEELKYQCYNLAYKNMCIRDVADIFKKLNPSLEILEENEGDLDNRDYRVSIERMREEGFYPFIDIETGAQEIMDAITNGMIPEPESIYYRNVEWLNYLIFNKNA